jgi:hypothetical protein
VLTGTTATTYQINTDGRAVGINGGVNFTGDAAYISQSRFINGSVPTSYQTSSTTLGTQIFIPPSSPLTTTSQGATAGDVKGLVTYTNAGIRDATARYTFETVGDAKISTVQSKFGGSSIAFDGNGDYLIFPANDMHIFRTADFTVEFWIYFNALASNQTVAGTASGYQTGGWQLIQVDAADKLSFLIESNPWKYVNTNVLTTGRWYHIAVSRSSGTLRMFVDGLLTGSAASTENISDSSGNRMAIGHTVELGAGRYFNGYINDFRITKGIGRYVQNFTPPTTAFLTK